jgi:hypothetical protein
MGRFFGAIQLKDLLCVDRYLFLSFIFLFHFSQSKLSDSASEGTILSGQGTLNRAAYAIHSAIHRARPDVTAACHAHTPWAKVGRS